MKTILPIKNILKRIAIWLGFLGIASAATLTVSNLTPEQVMYGPGVPDAGLYAKYEPYSRQTAPAPVKLCVNSATTTNCTAELYDIAYLEPKLTGQKVCLALLDTDGAGFTYITANNGILAADAATCRQ